MKANSLEERFEKLSSVLNLDTLNIGNYARMKYANRVDHMVIEDKEETILKLHSCDLFRTESDENRLNV